MKKMLSQEWLKAIACISMLVDHIGAVFVPGYGLRIVGRIAFPIFCFLLVEGAANTKSLGKYALRLAAGAVLAELPFDLLFYGGITWSHQNVMVTLLLGLAMICCARKRGRWLLPFCLCFFAAELLSVDYGGWGIALIALFMAARERKGWEGICWIGMFLIFLLMDSASIRVLGVRVSIQIFGVLSMIPIALYSGRKMTHNRAVQWGFYLFYPVHLLVLLWIRGG